MKKSTYNGLLIQGTLKENEEGYLEQLIETMNYSLEEYPRSYAIRVDLRLPSHGFLDDLTRDEAVSYSIRRTKLMSRFKESLSEKIKAQGMRRKKMGKRAAPCKVRYAWAREQDTSMHEHYHLVLLFNKDRFFTIGRYKQRDSLASLITGAWTSALGCSEEEALGLVHFPINHSYYIEKNSEHFVEQYSDLFYRISYLAKKRTKRYGEGHRCFGCSTR